MESHYLSLLQEEDSINDIGYDDVGGCKKQLAQIKSVELCIADFSAVTSLCSTYFNNQIIKVMSSAA